jgi:hypothetical protein
MNTPTVRSVRLTVALALAAVTLAAHATPLAGQYFGRNRVQYETFDFRILKTEHFDVYYYPETEAAARDAARMAERWYARLSRVLDYEFTERQPLILYANHPHFQQTNVSGSEISEGVQAFAEVFKQRIVMPFGSSYAEFDQVLGHELVHAFQYDITGLGRAGGGLEQAARRFQVPSWFVEGMPQYLSIGPVDPQPAMYLRDAALSGNIPSIEQMTYDPRYFPYRWGHALWAYVGGRWGDAVIGQILKQVGQGVPYPEAFQRILNISLDELSDDFQTSIRRAYLPMLAEYKEAREIAEPLITRRDEGGRLNLAPSLSPDGKQVAFLSELNNLDVELHVANAETGEVIRRLVRGSTFDTHFGSLRYISSSGTWSPDGQRFAFAALRQGADVVTVVDVNRAQIIREYRIPGVGELTNPSWSPDGTTIVVSGVHGGSSDLFALDVETGSSHKLTDDRYADLHPSFSPDGTTIAFVTDRGPGTDLDVLKYGGFRVALMDLQTGAIRPVPGMQGDNINPAWTRDGSGLFFVSNRTGIQNIYRLTLATGELSQVTDLFTGVSGITPLSPAITTARNADRLLFAAFERTGYNIYALSEPAALAGAPLRAAAVAVADTAARPVLPDTAVTGATVVAEAPTVLTDVTTSAATPEVEVPVAAVLPPHPRPTEAAFNRVSALVSDATIGLPSAAAVAAIPATPYRPRLSLDYLGQPQVGVSVGGGTFGRSGLYGGIAGIFSDVLGRHTVFGTVQAQGQLDEIGFSTVYLYRRTRWNIGAAAQRVPSIYGFFQQGFDQEGFFRQQIIRLRFFDTNLQALAQYPFSRVRRAEFSAGLRRISQDRQIFEIVREPQTGAMIDRNEFNVDGESFNLAEASAALVYDNALFGYTSPFAGQRYRFEISPTIGQLQFVQALGDYRRYFWLRPFTLAVRGLHFGRYGNDLENVFFGRGAFIGYPSLVRGYNDVFSDCRRQGNSCDLLDQLVGSRIGVANAELRFPLVRSLVLGVPTIAFPPIEGIAFFDAGVAWGRDAQGVETRPVFRRGVQRDAQGALTNERGFVTSAGVGARVNLFGYFILEVDYVNAFDRRDANGLARGWHWQFALQPGF